MRNFQRHPLKNPLMVLVCTGSLALTSTPLTAEVDSNAALLQQLQNQDALINNLLKRIEALEQKVSKSTDTQEASSAPPSPPAQRPAAVSDKRTAAGSIAQAPAAKREPGTLDVDERAADRALERTLTIQGALLLPSGVSEIVPYSVYARRDTDFPVLLFFDDSTTIGSQRIERDEVTLGIRGAIGLPFESQLEIDIPYTYAKERRFRTFTGVPIDDFNEHGSSIGDIRIGIAKTLMRQEGWKPDLLARFSWDTDTGDSVNNGVPLGNGFDDFRLSFTGLKRQDPLAFTATLSYTHSLEKDDLKPGDAIGLTLGTSMAASPSTSLSIAIAQSFQQDFEIDNNRVDGTSVNSATLLFGASSVLGRHTLLAVSAGVGLTSDAPDYTLSFSLPTRFW